MEHGRREQEPEQTPRRRPARPPRQRRSAGSAAKKVCFVLGTLMLIGVCTAAMIGGLFMKYVQTTLTPTLQVNADDYRMNLSSFVYYHDDSVEENDGWVEYQTLYGTENRIWVDIEDMPDALWQAAVAIEDHRFFEHNGVDWKRTAGAAVNMFIGMKNTFGGSTITQQVLKNMTKDDEGTVNRKVREIFRALEFEKNNTKMDILELYLNTIFLGKKCYGVQTAAEFYFGKDVSELDAAECASLIAITNNPSMYGPMYDIKITVKNDDGTTTVKTPRELNKQRQEQILDRMAGRQDTGLNYLTEEEADAFKAETLQFTDGTTSAEDLVAKATGGIQVNSWFVEQVFKDVARDLSAEFKVPVETAQAMLYNSGYKIYTTLDPKIQEIAESVYEDRSNLDVTSRNGEKIQSGITIIDPSTGNIVATVGAIGEKEGNLLTSYAMLQRQPGSSIKPLTVYAPALDAGAVTPASTFDNYPVRLLNDSPWPKNSPQGYSGWVTLSKGVASSLNTVAVQVLERLGTTESYAFATEKLGLSLVADDMNLAALGLGGLTYGLNTMQMAAAYASFANNGVYNAPRTYLRVEDRDGNVILENEAESHAAMKETTAYLMNELLKGVVSGGTGGSANFGGMTIAGKTGTTSENKDRYFVGYTPYYCAAVWTGYKTNEKISYSGNPAITMWKKVMQQIHKDLPNKGFSKPSGGLTTVRVCMDSGMLATDACAADSRGSRVINVTVATGTEPTEPCTMHVMRDYCTEGKCLAGENCPPESVVQAAFLDYTRVDYGENIKADDDAYLIPNMEKAVAETGCPVHTTPLADPDDPGGEWSDPSDPNYQPPASGGDDPSGGAPDTPAEPGQPDPNDPTGGFGDAGGDWWSNLWNNPGA